ncbi:Ribosomal protein (RP) transcription regulator [Komagataella phaffii]|uniref:Pre-rRNA-processing protein FHL1 n=2 Tax=Komagataella phaffii TaxID=460519 RepID=C4R8K1_KOMPG|nr:uncharacterized protein PAS_chr4_0980 [Komagataella phaffii GS115]AOA65234.1 GQ67_05043T0 [Komagataella phaffii]AOA69668.1 GQ68_05024T0 [Komagataella phaffii GS115]CAY71926.1 hypothetical protein PAS_chr4_0980 [Komagataella phaffii GS115]
MMSVSSNTVLDSSKPEQLDPEKYTKTIPQVKKEGVHDIIPPVQVDTIITKAGKTVDNAHIKTEKSKAKEGQPMLTQESALGNPKPSPTNGDSVSKVSAYARLDFEKSMFYVQTLQVVLGRNPDSNHHTVDVDLGNIKSVSRRHAIIHYNFAAQRFELSVLGRNGAFINDTFVESGITLPLSHGTKIQIGTIEFRFLLPSSKSRERSKSPSKQINPVDAVQLKTNLYKNSSKALHNSRGNLSSLSETEKDVSKSDDDVKLDERRKLSSNVLSTATPVGSSSSSTPKALNLSVSNPNDFDVNAPTRSGISIAQQVTEALQTAAVNPQSYPPPINQPLDAVALANLKKKEPRKKQPKQPKKVYTLEEIPPEYRTKPACSYSTLIATCLRARSTEKGMSLSEIYKAIQEIYPYYKYCPDGWQSSVRHNLSLNKLFKKVSKEGKGWLWGLDEEYCAEKEKVKKKQVAAAAAKVKSQQDRIQQQQQQHMQQLQNLQQKYSGSGSLPGNSPGSAIASPDITRSIVQKAAVGISDSPSPTPATPSSSNNIQAQLAANRSNPNIRPGQKPNQLSSDTMKALGYLQQELIKLTKDRKMTDKATTTTILTQALAMTIAQVNQAAKNAGIPGNPLASLIERNPQHVTKILTAALNAATLQVTKVKPPNATNVGTSSKALGTPKPPQASVVTQPSQARVQTPTQPPFKAPHVTSKPPPVQVPVATNISLNQLPSPAVKSEAKDSDPVVGAPKDSPSQSSPSPKSSASMIKKPNYYAKGQPGASADTINKLKRPEGFSKPNSLMKPQNNLGHPRLPMSFNARPGLVESTPATPGVSPPKPRAHQPQPYSKAQPLKPVGYVNREKASTQVDANSVPKVDQHTVDTLTDSSFLELPPELSNPELDKVLESFSASPTPDPIQPRKTDQVGDVDFDKELDVILSTPASVNNSRQATPTAEVPNLKRERTDSDEPEGNTIAKMAKSEQ